MCDLGYSNIDIPLVVKVINPSYTMQNPKLDDHFIRGKPNCTTLMPQIDMAPCLLILESFLCHHILYSGAPRLLISNFFQANTHH